MILSFTDKILEKDIKVALAAKAIGDDYHSCFLTLHDDNIEFLGEVMEGFIPVEPPDFSNQEKSSTSSSVMSYFKLTITSISQLEPALLKDIIIVTPPNQIIYKEEETFNPEGMVVKGKYSDGKEAYITDYTINPSGPLTSDINSVIVSYNGLSKKERIAVRSRLNTRSQTQLDFNTSTGSARVNLYTGCLLFEQERINIGVNTYQLNVGNIYNSHLRSNLPFDINT